MKNKKIFRTIPSLFAAAAMSVSMIGTAIPVFADEGGKTYEDGFVTANQNEKRDGFTVFANNKSEGGVTVSLGPTAFDKAYLALGLRVSYSLAEDGLLPVRFYANDTLLKGSVSTTLPVYDGAGKEASAVEMDENGYLALDGEFEGIVYFASSYLTDVTEISSVRAEFDGDHRGELTILNLFGCDALGLKPHEGDAEEPDISVTTQNGAIAADGFVLSYAGGAENGLVDATFKTPAAFDSDYLTIDVTAAAGAYVNFYVNGGNTALGSSSQTVSYLSKNAWEATNGVMQLNKSGGFLVLPENFNGVIAFAKSELAGVSRIESLQIEFDKTHSAALTVNGIHAAGRLVSFIDVSGKATITETVVDNTSAIDGEAVSISSNTSLFDRTAAYLAVKINTLSLSAGGDTWVYLRFIVNGNQIVGNTENGSTEMLYAYPADGSAAIRLEHKWGNWIIFPESFDGVIYIPMSQVGLSQDPTLFGFGFDNGHREKFEYKIGTAATLGGACTFTDLSSGQRLVNLQSYLSPEVMDISDFSSLEANAAGKITDTAVVCDSGVSAFDSYTYTYEEFGGVSLEESWEDELRVHIKSQAEGGTPATIPDDGDDFGNLEFDLGANAFDLSTGLAVNVMCISPECYFRVYLVDENGGVWSASYSGSYDFVTDGVTVGMATMYFNFFFGEGSYGTLYIPKNRFDPQTSYGGQAVTTGDTMGKIVKISFSFDMQYGLGRTMAIGAMANVDTGSKTITRLFTPAQMTDEELGIGTAQGTIVSCPGTGKHIANFALCRVTDEEVPGADNSIADSGVTLVATQIPLVTPESEGCNGALSGGALGGIGVAAIAAGAAIAVVSKKKRNQKGGK